MTEERKKGRGANEREYAPDLDLLHDSSRETMLRNHGLSDSLSPLVEAIGGGEAEE